jgi:error-prone DNA polymerase
MFQIESRAQMSCLPRLHPTHFYDIVVQVAIIRPGPIVGQMVNPFLMRRQGRQAVVYPHPSLEPVLARTLGVPLFQEQLLRMAMITAGFSGGEAEELRRAFGFKRSERRMGDIEVKLREGMQRNGIPPEAQEQIILSITSFALYGFPESHAASFALIAYASAYLKCHYLAAFTAALLNNQPMGFYSPATIVKDAQRHGLRVKPVDITCSDWLCTLEPEESTTMWDGLEGARLKPRRLESNPFRRGQSIGAPEGTPLQNHNCEQRFGLRMGFRYARGLREETAQAILRTRSQQAFESIADLAYRVPELRRNELVLLASIGALNSIGWKDEKKQIPRGLKATRDDKSKISFYEIEVPQGLKPGIRTAHHGTAKSRALSKQLPETVSSKAATKQLLHRRDALWQVERAARFAGPLLENIPENDEASPLAQMTPEERLVADFRGTGLTVGPHPMAYRRADLRRAGVLSAHELAQVPHGRYASLRGKGRARRRDSFSSAWKMKPALAMRSSRLTFLSGTAL